MSFLRTLRIKNFTKPLIRLYCDNKPVITVTPQVENKNDTSKDHLTDCDKFEKRVIKQVIIEKEQDAQIRIRLSKECNAFYTGLDKPLASVKYGSIRIPESIELQTKPDNDWISYNFGQLEASAVNCPPEDSVKSQTKSEAPNTKVDGKSAAKGGGDITGPSGSSSIPRPIRQEPAKVYFAFIPESWCNAFMPKTGVTGFWTFLFTFGTFLVSKEYYVLEHEFYTGISVFLLWVLGIKYMGKDVANYLDKGIDEYEKQWNEGRENKKKALEEEILVELHHQFEMDGQLLLCDAKRENVRLQLEEEFRKRQIIAYEEVKKRLDYQVAVNLVKQRIQHQNLIEYVTREVLKAVTPEMQSKLIYYSIDQIAQDIDKEKHKK